MSNQIDELFGQFREGFATVSGAFFDLKPTPPEVYVYVNLAG